MEALSISERYGLNLYISEQPPYNLLDRRIENELLPLCQKYELAILPWSPLAMGILAGRYAEAGNYPEESRAHLWDSSLVKARISQRGIEVGQAVSKMAQERGLTASQLFTMDQRPTGCHRAHYWSAYTRAPGRCTRHPGQNVQRR
jgi:aryl-alcohol dehydrogenase-like predicted oxidoreductase